ncbi:hypothetical protein KUCAC02_022494, partial [Chaenocephalus aceratus]
KLERVLVGGWTVVAIQSGSVEGAPDEASCSVILQELRVLSSPMNRAEEPQTGSSCSSEAQQTLSEGGVVFCKGGGIGASDILKSLKFLRGLQQWSRDIQGPCFVSASCSLLLDKQN